MTAEKINEAVEQIHKGVDQLFEIRQNLADMDIGDELLTMVDDAIEQFIDTSTWLSDNWFPFLLTPEGSTLWSGLIYCFL